MKHLLRIDLVILGDSRTEEHTRNANFLTRLEDGKVTWSMAVDNIGSVQQFSDRCYINSKHPTSEVDATVERTFHAAEVLELLKLGLDNSVEKEATRAS